MIPIKLFQCGTSWPAFFSVFLTVISLWTMSPSNMMRGLTSTACQQMAALCLYILYILYVCVCVFVSSYCMQTLIIECVHTVFIY